MRGSKKNINNRCSSKNTCPKGYECKKKKFFSYKRCRPTKKQLSRLSSQKKTQKISNSIENLENSIQRLKKNISNHLKKHNCSKLKISSQKKYKDVCFKPLKFKLIQKKKYEEYRDKLKPILDMLSSQQETLDNLNGVL